MRLSLRTKLIISFLVVVLITGFFATWVGVRLIGSGIIRQAQDKVRVDLNSARHIYQDKLEEVKYVVRFNVNRFFIRDVLLGGDIEFLQDELRRIREREALDVLTATDKNGIVVFRAKNPAVYGDSQAGDEVVNFTLSNREVVASTVIVSREELLKEGNDLAERAHIKLIPTPRAKPRPEGVETSGMMIKAAAPVFDYGGNLLGVLYGGKLLNRDYEIVDEVKETVYQGQTYKGKDMGTATIFQGDLRISTNVKRKDGSRAIGTRVSEEVNNQVLVKGLPWIERAFVVNDWYITAYEPIRNIRGNIIGILYVGILEGKFVDMRRRTMWMFLGITFAGIMVATIASYFLANGVLKPIKHLVWASKQIAGGDLTYRVKLKTKGEIGELGEAFNFMASSLKDRDEQLKERAKQTIMKSERLATLGKLAAGVAHEINNPISGILTYIKLLSKKLEKGEDTSEFKRYLTIMERETARVGRTVKNLLDFSRKQEPDITSIDINEVIEQSLLLLNKSFTIGNIDVKRESMGHIPKILGDFGQLQQVFINLVLNSMQAMKEGGRLQIKIRSEESSGRLCFVRIEVSDNGCGIPKRNIPKIFDPFFTTKGGKDGIGLGLGLSIVQSIINAHNGHIHVESKVKEGTTFTVWLPI